MALYKPTYTDAAGRRRRSAVWWLEWTDEAGRRRAQSLKVRDRRAAEHAAREILTRRDRRFVGAETPLDGHAARSVSEHAEDFHDALEAKGGTKEHQADRRRLLDRFLKATGVVRLAELDGARASAWLTSLRESGLSARRVNEHRMALCCWTRWLVREGRLGRDPFAGLPTLNVAAARRRVRRPFSDAELVALADAVRRGPLERRRARGTEPSPQRVAYLEGLGERRAFLFLFAAGTGLRRAELRRLRWTDLDLERGILTVPAASAKARREQWIPLRRDLLARLVALRQDGTPGRAGPDPVFARDTFPARPTFRADLALAGIPVQDDEGRFVDFHALRSTFASALVRGGANPAHARLLMRHASIETTLTHYVGIGVEDLRGALEKTTARPATFGTTIGTVGSERRQQSTSDDCSSGPGASIMPGAARPKTG